MTNIEWLDSYSLIGFTSVLLFQFLFIGLQWAFIQRKEYGYYLAYMLGIGCYSVLKYSHLQIPFINQDAVKILELKLELILPILSYFLYYRFARAFLEMPKRYERYNGWVKKMEYFLLFYICIEACLVLLKLEKPTREIVFHVVSFILFSFSCYMIFIFLKMRIKLTYFIVIGALVLNIGAFATMVLYIMREKGVGLGFHPMLVSNLTNVFELLAFSTGLSYKAIVIDRERLAAKEELISNLREKFSLQEKIYRIRQSSARELHDEIASGMSDLTIFTGLIEKELKPEQEKQRHLVNQIKVRSVQILEALHDLIWSLNPDNHSLQELNKKIQALSREKLAPFNIGWNVSIAPEFLNTQPDAVLMRNAVSLYRNILDCFAQKGMKTIDVSFDGSTNVLLFSITFSTHIYVIDEHFLHQIRKTGATSIQNASLLSFQLILTRISD
jgi:signal transduction histidine kinase